MGGGCKKNTCWKRGGGGIVIFGIVAARNFEKQKLLKNFLLRASDHRQWFGKSVVEEHAINERPVNKLVEQFSHQFSLGDFPVEI